MAQSLLGLVLRWRTLFFLPVVLWQVLFAFAPLIPLSARPRIDVDSLPRIDSLLAGTLPHQALTASLASIATDLFCALPYTIHFILPFAALAFLLVRARSKVESFAFAFGILNLTAVATQLLLPTSPPWYYERYANTPASYTMPGDAARLSNVDALFGISFYSRLYGTSPVVFGSFPSLHAGWPFFLAVFFYPSGKALFLYSAWVWFAAMYLWHHYLIDILGGMLFAAASVWIAKRVVKTPTSQPSTDNFVDV